MKLLQENFTTNADKSGEQRFIQLRKEGNTGLYRRETMEGHLVGFEVFTFKTIQAGAPLPGGGTVSETYESYPGGKAFGRNAWFIGGHGAEVRANQRFNQLVQGAIKVESVESDDETITLPVVRVSTPRTERRKLNLPSKPFSQKELAAFNNIENYKEVYTDLQRMLGNGTLRKGQMRVNTGRGKDIQLFEVVTVGTPAIVTV